MKIATRSVQEVAFFQWRESTENQRIDVHRPVARRPFEASQPPSEMLARSDLATPIAEQTHYI
jgi:hypothetical protein